jgi:hypothetical protein
MSGLGLTSSAYAAQGATGRLTGTVANPQGEVIAGATVTATDNGTGKVHETTTGSEGNYSFPQLEVGTYTIKATAQGFKTFTATEVKIDVGKEYGLNLTLEVGDISENVTVTAGAEVIHTTNAELSNTVSTRQIQELPLNGRNPLSLVSLQAGTASNGATTTTINGQRSSFTNITRDGINVQDNFIRANAVDFIPDRPNVDDVGEFTVVTANAGAEAGYGASQVQLVTPRGSNEFHGSIYWYNRNSKLAANTFFNNASGNDPVTGADLVPRPFLNRNQFGGRAGGPIVKEKLFFFGAYEGFRLRQSSSRLQTVLTPTARNGIFSYLDNSGVRRTVNVLQLAGVPADPAVASRFLSNIPSGNSRDTGDGFNTTGYRFSRKANQDREAVTGRVDYEINDRNSLSGVYSYRKEFLLRDDVDGGQGFSTTPFSFQDAHTQFLALAYRMNPTDRFTNEIRGGFQFSDPAFGSEFEDLVDFFVTLPLVTNPEVTFRNQGRDTKIINFQDNAVYVKSQHSLRFGGQLNFFTILASNAAGTKPTYALGTNVNTPSLATGQFPGGITAAQLGTANNLLALLGGIVSSGAQTFNVNSRNAGFVPGVAALRNLAYEHISTYFSDQWRVTPQLTLNLGLRWELFTPVRNPDGLALEPAIADGADPVTAVLNPNGVFAFVGNNSGGKNFFKADWDNFAPVVSVAWAPEFNKKFFSAIFPGGGRSVLRAGYRESYVNDEFVRAADNALLNNSGLQLGSNAINPATGTTALNARLSALPGIPVPAFTLSRTFLQNNLAGARQAAAFAIDPDLKVPRIQEYNVSFEREIGFQTAIEIRYVGGRSKNLVRSVDYNQVDIFNNGFLDDFNRARFNLVNFGNPACANPATGCQTLTVFPRLGSAGLLNNATIRSQILAGTPADLAVTYIINNLAGTVRFTANPNIFVANVLENAAEYNYNALQTEIRRRFANGFYLQANYTFQKTLTDAGGTGQTRVDPPLDLFNRHLDYSRADFDQTHIFNLNTIYELPFGRGKALLNDSNGVVDRIVGGWQLTSILRWTSGAPISVLDARGTLNRAGRSGRQTATSDLSKGQIKDLIGIFKTPCGIYFINPSVINKDFTDCTGTGRGAEGFGTTPFEGQVFFNNAPGKTGNLERTFINGPVFFNWDASLIKNIPIKEDLRLQFRIEAFNVLNNTNFFSGDLNINSVNFGRITSTFAPRVIQLVGRIEF